MVILGDLHIDSRVGNTNVSDVFAQHMDTVINFVNTQDKVILLGDYFNPSEPYNVYREKLSDMLCKIKVPIRMLVGNHDRDKRGSYSVSYLTPFWKVTDNKVIDTYLEEGDCCYISYTLEFDKMKEIINKTKCKYIIGHFSFEYEKGNRIMKGEIEYDKAWDDKIFILGHIHKSQQKNNVIYVGSASPTNLGELDYKFRYAYFDKNNMLQFKELKYEFSEKVIKNVNDLNGVDENTRVIIDIDNAEEKNKIMAMLADKKVLGCKAISKEHNIDISKLKVTELVKEYLEKLGRTDLYEEAMKFVPKNVVGVE